MSRDNPAWRFVEIDNKIIEFCDGSGCPFNYDDYGGHRCLYPGNEEGMCVLTDADKMIESYPCPARVIPNITVCKDCDGMGEVWVDSYENDVGTVSYPVTCEKCHGSGKIPLVAKCPDCDGTGFNGVFFVNPNSPKPCLKCGGKGWL